MNINIEENKNKIAIVAVGYNRIKSMQRLLQSLESAHYNHQDIPLVISIDASGDQELYDYVRHFEWSHGEKYVNIQDERLGLRKHIIQCGDLTEYFRAVIILEDDIFVSEYFYQYVEAAVNFYEEEDRVGGISLYQNEMNGTLPICFMNDGSDTYLKQSPASWGECWTSSQWSKFKKWYNEFDDSRFSELDMPEYIKSWKKAWSKYYMAYLIDTNRYFVFPHVSHTTCFSDAGEHNANHSTIGQVNLLCGSKEYQFKPFDEMVKYDIYFTNQDIYEWVGISESELCVDFDGKNSNIRNKRYLLTPIELPYKKMQSYGLQMRPIELNVRYRIAGTGLFLYDTLGESYYKGGQELPLSVAYYYLRLFNFKLTKKYLIDAYKTKIANQIRRFFRIR